MNQSDEKLPLILPGLGGIYDNLKPYAYTILRVMMGLFFVPHGMQKLFGMFGAPPIEIYVKGFGRMGEFWAQPGWVYYIGTLEFVGGLMLAVGLFTRVVAIQFVGFMFMAAFVANWPRGWFWTKGGIEAPLSWGIVCLVILILGAGKHSLDAKIGKEF
ncbi:MAG: DoxX family protein [Rhodospirillales bacterium]|nr:DoxX family protein [Rhodospirillales bacterium]